MPRFAANTRYLFTEHPPLERYGAAAACGFKGVEASLPYAYPAEKLGDLIAMAGLTAVFITSPPGDWEKGERGIAALKGRFFEFQDDMELALSYCELMDCKAIHVLAGLVEEEDRAAAMDRFRGSLAWAAKRAAEDGVRLLVEAISPQGLPGYLLRKPSNMVDLLDGMDDARNVFMMYDLYHAQLTEGGITDFIEANLARIGHIQIAQVPSRHEPDGQGEINFPYLFNLLDAHGYPGWVGAEYEPRTTTEAGLGWGKPWGLGRKG